MKRIVFVLAMASIAILNSCKKEDLSPIEKSKVSFEDIDKTEKAAPYIDPRGGDDVISPTPMP
jgi:hypothetical protein